MPSRVNPLTDFDRRLEVGVKKYGGLLNAHAHLDRANTLDARYLDHVGIEPFKASSYPLHVKQDLTGDLHRGPAYEPEDLKERMSYLLDRMIEFDTRRVDSLIDTTADEVGLTALEVALGLKEEYRERIDLRLAAFGIFGFKDSAPERWDVFVEGARMADFLGSLPERDAREGHVGYDEHIRRVLKLAHELRKSIHVHVDQGNDPRESGTETLIEAVKWLGSPEVDGEYPSVWAVHAISPSTYEEERFRKMVDGLLKYEIGVICCPSAAISMRQLRPFKTPIYNSIARVLDFVDARVPVRIGTDNIADVFVPSGTPNLYSEIGVLTNAVRFYNPDIWAKIATGTELTDMDIELVRGSLQQDKKAWDEIPEDL